MPSVPKPTIIRSARKSIAFHITPQGELVVKAPFFLPQFVIQQSINERLDWITKTVGKLEKRQVKTRQYVEGEEFLYLGKVYKLHLGIFSEISLTNDTLQFPEFLLFRVQKELENWYKRRAKEVITKRLEHYAQEMKAAYVGVRFSDTISKWGTCDAENNLQFNWRLVMTPLMVLDYVVIHELAHTTEKNHSWRFWALVRKHTPAYRQHRKWLNDNAHLLTF